MDGTITILQKRLSDKGMTEATVTRQGDRGIRVEIPSAEEDPSTISEYLSSPAKLEWKDADGNVVVEGEHVTQAKAGNMDGKWVVSFSLDSEGTAAFAEATANNIGKQLSIYVDDKLISSPTVNSAITGGSGVIEGSFTAESAQELATQIESAGDVSTVAIIFSVLVSALVGLMSIRFMLRLVRNHKLYGFAIYVACMGVFVLVCQLFGVLFPPLFG